MKLQKKTHIPFAAFETEPSVRLVNAFNSPYDNSIAAARTCYSSKVINPEDVRRDAPSRERRDAIAKSTYQAGHHTILQHATFQFVIERVSRNCIWSFLHSHPFYNSEQVSQRYVPVSSENFSIPHLPRNCKTAYVETVHYLMNAYVKIQGLLKPAVEKEYSKIFPNKRADEKEWAGAVKKRSQEAARYLLPLATHAHLYHTISGLTIYRYWRICQSFDAPAEQRKVAEKMMDAVRKHDPDFLKNAEDPIPLEETPEYSFFSGHADSNGNRNLFIKEFDASLKGFSSRLIDDKGNCEKVMADSVRNVLGLNRSQLKDEPAIMLVMDPAKNRYLSDTLNLTHHTKIGRTMAHAHFTFRKKISHTADSQDQRHRTTPGSRPILARHFTAHPDFIVPALIKMNSSAFEFYSATMEGLWKRILKLLEMGAGMEAALYLLPNAFPIRFEESGSLLDFHHKWVHRLCYTAQEEIWRSCLEEARQVKKKFPVIGTHIYAPCALRKNAGKAPFCPEGERYCGVPVWKISVDEYERII